MALAIVVFSGIVLAVTIPGLYRLFPRLGRLLAVALPAVLTAWLLSLSSDVLEGPVPAVSVPWIPSLGISFALRLDGLSPVRLADHRHRRLSAMPVATSRQPATGTVLRLHPGLLASMLGVAPADDPFVLYVFWN